MIVDWANASQSAAVVVHADCNYNIPRLQPVQRLGYINALMIHVRDRTWELEVANPRSTKRVGLCRLYPYGDVDVLYRLLPNSAAPNYVNITAPPKSYTAWTLVVDDATLPGLSSPLFIGAGAVVYGLLPPIPIITGTPSLCGPPTISSTTNSVSGPRRS